MLQPKRNGDCHLQCTAGEEAGLLSPGVAPFARKFIRERCHQPHSPAPSGAQGRMHTCSAEAGLVTYY